MDDGIGNQRKLLVESPKYKEMKQGYDLHGCCTSGFIIYTTIG